MGKRRAHRPMDPAVVDLTAFRERRKLSEYREKIDRVVEANRRAIGRLYTTGTLFSGRGVRAGRDLLLAHQHLLRVVALLDRLSDRSQVPAPRSATQVNAVYSELDELLERTSELTVRTGNYLARLWGE